MTNTKPMSPAANAGIFHHIFLWAVVACSLWFSWTGYVASDDVFYATAGAGWAYQFPFVGQTFAEARAVIALPIGVMIRLLGESEFSVTASTCIFFAATASLTLGFLARLVGVYAATVSSCLLATVPLFALKATIPSADLPELFFVAASVWLFWLALQRERRSSALLVSGACTALAFGAHEITGGLIIGYGVLFLFGYGMPRRHYWVMAIGFSGVVALECFYYWVFAGNPLHRLAMLLPILAAGSGVAPSRGDRVDPGVLEIARGGTLHVHQAIDPILMFFTHHDFGLLGYVAVPALWWCCVTMRHDRSAPVVTARMFAVFALVWFLFAALLLRQAILITRYYMVVAYFLYVISALWACVAVWPHRAKLLYAGGFIFAVGNLTAIFLDNKNPRFAERALVSYLAQSQGPIRVDPNTANRVRLFCRWSGQDCARISTTFSEGALYFYNPSNKAPSFGAAPSPQQALLDHPRPEWELVWRLNEPDKPLTSLVGFLGLDKRMPQTLYRKVAGPGSYVAVYRLPARTVGTD